MKDNETIRITSICDSHVQNANLDTYLPSIGILKICQLKTSPRIPLHGDPRRPSS